MLRSKIITFLLFTEDPLDLFLFTSIVLTSIKRSKYVRLWHGSAKSSLCFY